MFFTCVAIFVPLLIVLLIGAMLQDFAQRRFRLPRLFGGSGPAASEDPRVAAAAMMYAVAAEAGDVSAEKERQMVSLLSATAGIEPALARKCLKQGRRLSRLNGNLTSRLHQLKGPVEQKCSAEEKRELLEVLRKVAGASGERIGPVRDSLGRLSASLLHG